MDLKFAKYLIEKTKNDYELLAKDFTRTRSFLPEDVKKLTFEIKEGEKILDLGCAHGKLFEILKEKKVNYFGIDISEKLIEIAKKNFPEGNFQVANALNLPFPENFFDKVFSIAVFHHIPSKEFRIQCLKEIKRVLKRGGILILRVWDFWKRWDRIKLILKYSFLKLIGKSKLDFFDVFLPWKDSRGKILTERYFHCFTKRELKNLGKKVNLKIVRCWREGKGKRANIYLILKKDF